MESLPRNEIIKTALDNMDQDEVKAYFDGSHPRHDAVVKEVTETLETYLGSEEKASGLLELNEQRARQELYDDPRSIDVQVRDILNGHDPRWSKPYFDSGHHLHSEAVRRMEILSEARYGDQPYMKEVMPIVSQTVAKNEADDEDYESDGEGAYVNNGCTAVIHSTGD